jgi:hypothetical protein
VATGRGDAAVAIIAITARREDAAKMLLERNPGFFRNVCGVGIDGPKKIPDLLLNFPLYQELCTMGYGDLAWLDLLVHFSLHPCHPRSGGSCYSGKPMVDC